MRSRSEHARWLPTMDADQGWLSRIPDELDIVEADDAESAHADGARLVNDAIPHRLRAYTVLSPSGRRAHEPDSAFGPERQRAIPDSS